MATVVNMNSLLNGKDSRWLQLEVCREFQRNKCSRADTECKFAHPPANVEVQSGKVTACYDSIKGRCNRDKPPCKYFHPPQHLKDQLLINGRNHLALKNALMQQMGIAPGQPVIPGQVPTVATNPYLTGIPANTYNPFYAPGHLVPALLPDPSAVASQMGAVVPQAVQVAQQKIPRSDRLETAPVSAAALVQQQQQHNLQQHLQQQHHQQQQQQQQQQQSQQQQQLHIATSTNNSNNNNNNNATNTIATSSAAALVAAAVASQASTAGSVALGHHQAAAAAYALEVGKKRAAETDMFQLAFSGMVPYKRPAGEKSGIPVYQPGATTYQQLMQLQQPFVPVSSYANNSNNNNTTQTTSLMNNTNNNNSHGQSNGVNNSFTQLGHNSGHMVTTGNNNTNNNNNIVNNDNINSSNLNNNNNNKNIDSSCLTNQTANITTTTTTATTNTTTNTSTVTNNILTDTATTTEPLSPKHNHDKYALLNNNNNSIIDKNLGNTAVPNDAKNATNINGTSDSSNNNNNNNNNHSHLNENTEIRNQNETDRNSYIFNTNGEHFDEKSSTSVSNDSVTITLNGNDNKSNDEPIAVNGAALAPLKTTTSSSGILPTPSTAHTTMVNNSNVYTNPYQQNLRYYNPFVSAAAAMPGASYPQAVVSSSFNVSQPQFSYAATPTYTYGSYASAPPTPTGVSSAASYYAADPAALAKEVAQKNYAHAVKMAASANPLAGKPLTAAAYTGMSLNKPFAHVPTTSNIAAQHAAFFQAQHAQAAAAMAAAQMRNMAASSLPGSSMTSPMATPTHQPNNMLQRSATTGYLPAAAAPTLNMLRQPTMAMSAPTQGSHFAAISQPTQAFFYPGMMAPTAYPFANAMSGMPTAIAPAAAAAAAAPGTALVLNPYKKMKTS